mmetsp:Transcript_89273/g.230433  ORF Transcript_89273/g.230433 Transcript_89273/m.230433 type:complete len:204 (+) Transcript_89273:744-1355(+)
MLSKDDIWWGWLRRRRRQARRKSSRITLPRHRRSLACGRAPCSPRRPSMTCSLLPSLPSCCMAWCPRSWRHGPCSARGQPSTTSSRRSPWTRVQGRSVERARSSWRYPLPCVGGPARAWGPASTRAAINCDPSASLAARCRRAPLSTAMTQGYRDTRDGGSECCVHVGALLTWLRSTSLMKHPTFLYRSQLRHATPGCSMHCM